MHGLVAGDPALAASKGHSLVGVLGTQLGEQRLRDGGVVGGRDRQLQIDGVTGERHDLFRDDLARAQHRRLRRVDRLVADHSLRVVGQGVEPHRTSGLMTGERLGGEQEAVESAVQRRVHRV